MNTRNYNFYAVLSIILMLGTVHSRAQEAWSLQRCIDYAFQKNIQIMQGQLNVENSDAGRTLSRASALPNINGQFSHGYNWGQTIDPFTNQFATDRIRSNNLGVNASMVLFNGFQRLNTISQSDLDLEARKRDLERIQNDVALNVANAYLNILFTEEFLNVARYNLESSSEQARRVAQLVEAGSMARGALYDIQAQEALDESSVISAENNLRLAYLNLTILLQLSPEEAENFRIEKPDLEDLSGIELVASVSQVVNSALQSFPEIKSAETDLMAAQKGLNVAKGTVSPRLSVSFSYGSGYSGANRIATDSVNFGFIPLGQVMGTGELVTSLSEQIYPSGFETKAFGDQLEDNLNRSLFFTLSVPIFNGLSSRTNVQRAKIGLESARLNLENNKNTLSQNVQRAYADAQAALRSYQASQKAVTAAQEAFNYAEIRYAEGVINATDFTAARVRLDSAKADMIRNKFDYVFKAKVVDFYLGKPITLR